MILMILLIIGFAAMLWFAGYYRADQELTKDKLEQQEIFKILKELRRAK